MIRAIFGRGLLVLTAVLSLIGLVSGTTVLWPLVSITVVSGFLLTAGSHRQYWIDGWHAAHEHHHIDDPHIQLSKYQKELARLS